jgi:hypothetical protein
MQGPSTSSRPLCNASLASAKIGRRDISDQTPAPCYSLQLQESKTKDQPIGQSSAQQHPPLDALTRADTQ